MFAMTRARLQIAVIVGATFAALLAALLALAAFSSTASASHSWSSFHWGRTGSSFTLKLGDNVSTAWDKYLQAASGQDAYSNDNSSTNGIRDWTDSTVLNADMVAGVKDPLQCSPTSGQVEVCNAKYGSNGWLGLASIWISDGHIVQGAAKMNDTYFTTSTYNTPAWRRLVMCQEVGHTFGLAHQDTTSNNRNLGTCMDYTNDPNGGSGGYSSSDPSNEYPNKHDYDQLISIYGPHLDSSNTYGTTSSASKLPPAALAIDTTDPRQRGQLIDRSSDGRVEVYMRDFGQGHKVITRLIRVVEKTPLPDEQPTAPGGEAPHSHDDSHEH